MNKRVDYWRNIARTNATTAEVRERMIDELVKEVRSLRFKVQHLEEQLNDRSRTIPEDDT